MTDHLILEKQLCFRLYNVNKAMNRLYNKLLIDLNLTYPQYLVMLVLWQQQRAISIKELGKKLDLDSGTLSPLLKRLEKTDYIVRKRNNVDERVVEIYLTTQGKALKIKAEKIPSLMFAKTGLSSEELQQLNGTLDHLLSQLSN